MRPIDGDALKKKFADSDPNKDFGVNYFLISIDEMPTLSLSSIPQPPNTKPRSHDAVNHPSHYTQGGIECIDALKAATVGLTGIEAVCTANAIKYLWRWKFKNGVEDIDKAIWYLNRLKDEVQSREEM